MPREYNIGEEPNTLKPTVPPEPRKNLLKLSTCKVSSFSTDAKENGWCNWQMHIIYRKNRDRSPGLNSQLGPQKEDGI